jgi:hypothetical protein
MRAPEPRSSARVGAAKWGSRRSTRRPPAIGSGSGWCAGLEQQPRPRQRGGIGRQLRAACDRVRPTSAARAPPDGVAVAANWINPQIAQPRSTGPSDFGIGTSPAPVTDAAATGTRPGSVACTWANDRASWPASTNSAKRDPNPICVRNRRVATRPISAPIPGAQPGALAFPRPPRDEKPRALSPGVSKTTPLFRGRRWPRSAC